MTTTKLPTSDRPLVRDPDLAAALERELKPYSGARLDAAQQAVRQVAAGGAIGTFDGLVAQYKAAIQKAVAGVKGSRTETETD